MKEQIKKSLLNQVELIEQTSNKATISELADLSLAMAQICKCIILIDENERMRNSSRRVNHHN